MSTLPVEIIAYIMSFVNNAAKRTLHRELRWVFKAHKYGMLRFDHIIRDNDEMALTVLAAYDADVRAEAALGPLPYYASYRRLCRLLYRLQQ